ncbi:hypothetical protein L195_g037913 [Trifolium pratense]|uniref:Uncharacterized protein n=1 Tax=Trifolium pratense TaxID=57577 RepID=A0A2K3LTN0_TRIPR|nr:hypothetical protein L195_g037913 [Trifolium pratense]
MGSQDHFTCKTLKAEYPVAKLSKRSIQLQSSQSGVSNCKALKAEYQSCKTIKAEYPGFKTFKAKWRTSVGFQNFQSKVESQS